MPAQPPTHAHRATATACRKNERPAANLANEKWGWISEKAGSWAELEVDTTTDLQVRCWSLVELPGLVESRPGPMPSCRSAPSLVWCCAQGLPRTRLTAPAAPWVSPSRLAGRPPVGDQRGGAHVPEELRKDGQGQGGVRVGMHVSRGQ